MNQGFFFGESHPLLPRGIEGGGRGNVRTYFREEELGESAAEKSGCNGTSL